MGVPQPRNLRARVKAAQEQRDKKATLQKMASAMDALHRKRDLEQDLDAIQDQYADYLAKVLDTARARRKVPVQLGNLLGPDGNVFWIVNNCHRALSWAEKNGLDDCITPGAVAVVKGYASRTYEETLDMVLLYYLDIDNSIARLRAYRDTDLPRADSPTFG